MIYCCQACMLCLLESKGPDMTACMISSSPILLYLFKGVKSQKKRKKNTLVYWIHSAVGKLKTFSFTPCKPCELYL